MRALPFLVVVALCACAPERQEWEDTFTGDGDDAFLLDDDFVCLADDRWTDVDGRRVMNVLGFQDDAVRIARDHAEGETYPVGTVIQLFPGEASVKRGAGFSAETDDWEFLVLDTNTGKSVITARGTTEIGNLGGSCIGCHAAAKDFDDVCFTNKECAPLPFFIDTHVDPKEDDARCK